MIPPDTSTIDLSQMAGTWALDPERTTVTFRTKAMWIVPVKGAARAVSGDAQIGPNGAVKGTLVIDTASVTTGNKRRDNHLRSDAILAVAKYPTIVFTSNGGRPRDGQVEITGVLTVHGQSQPLTLQAEVTGSRTSVKVSTKVEIDRSLWGVTWPGEAMIGAGLKNQVVIRAHFERI